MSEPLDYEAEKFEPPPAPKGAMLAIFLIVLSDLMGFGVIIPLLPFYARQYAASDFQVGLLFSVYSICQLIATPLLGLASDRFGRRPVLILSQIGSVLGYLLLTYATAHHWNTVAMGLVMVYIARAIDGISGGNISTAQAYISDVTTPQNRAKGMGMLGAAFGIGFTIGPAVGGMLGSFHIWLPALAAALCSAVAATQTYFRLPESKHHDHTETDVWLHPSKFSPILRNSPLVQLLLISFFSMMAFVMMESTFAIFLNDTFHLRNGTPFGPREVGYFFGFAGIIIIVVQGGLVGRLTKSLGEWTLTIVGPILVTAAMLTYVNAAFHPLILLLIIGGLMNATGRSLQTPALSSLVSQFSDPKQQGTVFGLFHMLGSLARAIGPAIACSIYAVHRTSPYFTAGTMTFAVMLWTIFMWREYGAANPQKTAVPAVAATATD
jgi:DHA1 family tetracycline resistance protein-like MFS transporter